jgi:23S rRNA pseudoU1915 N3-methylase RlmH
MNLNQTVGLSAIAIGIVTSLSVARVDSQAPPSPDQMVAALKQNLAESQKRLRQYEWVETTSISLKGEEKSRKQQRVYYGADGTLTKLPIGEQQPQAKPAPSRGRRGGAVKQAIVENKTDEMKEYMEKAAALIHQYVPPDPAQIQKAKDAGNMAVKPQPDGKVQVEFRNYVQPNDSLSIGVDAKAALLSALNVATYLEKPEDTVTLNVLFATLTDATSYTAKTTLDVKAKNIRVVVENSGHRPLAR